MGPAVVAPPPFSYSRAADVTGVKLNFPSAPASEQLLCRFQVQTGGAGVLRYHGLLPRLGHPLHGKPPPGVHGLSVRDKSQWGRFVSSRLVMDKTIPKHDAPRLSFANDLGAQQVP